MQAVQLGFARRVLAQERRQRNPAHAALFDRAPQHIWQARFYDFNVWTEKKRIEKLRYMHRNPVKRGLVVRPEEWRWSSFRHYALKEKGPVEINAVFSVPVGRSLPRGEITTHTRQARVG